MVGGTEAILLVEDDPVLRQAGKRLLEARGYTVIAAQDGLEALGILRQRPGDVDLVVTDVVMPRMGGPELYDAARREGLATPFLFTSGHSDQVRRSRAGLDPAAAFVEKPWLPAEFLGRVRQALDQSGTRGSGTVDGRGALRRRSDAI